MSFVSSLNNPSYRPATTAPAKTHDEAGFFVPVLLLIALIVSCVKENSEPKPDAAASAPDTAPDLLKNDLNFKYDIVRIADGITPVFPDAGADSQIVPDTLLPDILPPILDTQAMETGLVEVGKETAAEAPVDAGSGCPLVLPATNDPQINDDLSTFNTAIWSKANGWSNDNPFNCGWRGDHISFGSGLMTILLDNAGCPAACSSKPYASGEYRTINYDYGFGLFEVRMKPVSVSGVISSFFVYTGPSDGNVWDEIDIEFIPTGLQTNYYVNGVGGHEDDPPLTLSFDPASSFHEYAFRWSKDEICWYVDRQRVRQVKSVDDRGNPVALPVTPGRIMMSLWPAIGKDAWVGPFNYSGPIAAQYDWVRYTPL